MADLTEAMKEVYASNPVDEMALMTIELRHPLFLDDNGVAGAVRLVNDWADLYAQLEPDAPMDGGQLVTFTRCAFTLKKPGITAGDVPQMVFVVDGVSRDVIAQLERAQTQLQGMQMTARDYLRSDLSGPQTVPPIDMEVTSIKCDMLRVTITASLDTLNNAPFPAQSYTAARFPGLVR